MDVMIDIETMGQSSRAAVLSIGAVAFDPYSDTLVNTPPTPPKNAFYVDINLTTCIKAGLEVDADTIYWWMAQHSNARDIITQSDKTPLTQALHDFNTWLKDQSLERVWSLPSTFDLVILNNAFRSIGSRPAWHHRQEHCMRTLLSLHPTIERYEHPDAIKHHALWDAWVQAISVQQCMQTGKEVVAKTKYDNEQWREA